MEKYFVKGMGNNKKEYVEIVNEEQDGYEVLITRETEDFKEKKQEFISRSLFETCLRTNYLIKLNSNSPETIEV